MGLEDPNSQAREVCAMPFFVFRVAASMVERIGCRESGLWRRIRCRGSRKWCCRPSFADAAEHDETHWIYRKTMHGSPERKAKWLSHSSEFALLQLHFYSCHRCCCFSMQKNAVWASGNYNFEPQVPNLLGLQGLYYKLRRISRGRQA